MWKLIIEDDEGKRTIVPLTRDAYTLGRKEGNSIRLTERNVSRDHAKIRTKGGAPSNTDKLTYALMDTSSYNGVYVNGLRVAAEQELAHGDLVQIGDYRIVFQDDAATDAPATQVQAPDLKSTVPGTTTARASSSTLMDKPNRLVMLAGPTPGAEFPLGPDRLMTIGRAEDASVSINHNSVSRLHCEVHPLGDGRFEIVDKGSSNGVRVNAAELRRGIIEANDVIELGDVKFKFIGAGQIFRPGATESQQLSAIGDRTASLLTAERRGGGVLPYVVFGAVVAAGAIGAWYLTRPRPDPATIQPQPIGPAEIGDPAVILAEARKLCDQGEIDSCYEKLATELPEGAPQREGPEAKAIASSWADKQLERAGSDPVLPRRRSLLGQVAASTLVDNEHRKQAQDRLSALDALERAATPVDRGASEAAPAGDASAPVVPRKPARPPGSPPTGALTGSSVPSVPKAGDMERVRQLMLQGPSGYESARSVLEKRVFANKGSREEIEALKAVCKAQGDKACVEHCKQLLGPQP